MRVGVGVWPPGAAVPALRQRLRRRRRYRGCGDRRWPSFRSASPARLRYETGEAGGHRGCDLGLRMVPATAASRNRRGESPTGLGSGDPRLYVRVPLCGSSQSFRALASLPHRRSPACCGVSSPRLRHSCSRRSAWAIADGWALSPHCADLRSMVCRVIDPLAGRLFSAGWRWGSP